MGTYTLDELVRRWQVGDLTIEQVIGQMLLLLRELDERVQELEQAPFKKSRPARRGVAD